MVLLIIGLILLFIILLIFIFRYQLFGISPNLSNDEYTKQGYGYYSEPQTTECINQSGLCSETGLIATISNCIQNKDTGRGCIDTNGFQTFNTKISETNCSTNCRFSIWSESNVSECEVADDCMEYGIITLTKTCVQNDAYGMNNCTYNKNENTEIFPGCHIINNGVTVECDVGTIYKETQTCLNPNYQVCGNWEVNYGNNSKKCMIHRDDWSIKSDNFYRKLPMKCSTNKCKPVINCIDDTTTIGKNLIKDNFRRGIAPIICGKEPWCARPASFV